MSARLCAGCAFAFALIRLTVVDASAEGLPPGAPAAGDGAGLSSSILDDITELRKLRDPFKKPEGLVKAANSAPPRSVLEQFPSDQYKMIGVLTGMGKVKAMLLAPDSKTLIASEKDRIGQRSGVIRKITSDRVFIREKVVTTIGETEAVDIELRLEPLHKGAELIKQGRTE
jgi:hypothetical protein